MSDVQAIGSVVASQRWEDHSLWRSLGLLYGHVADNSASIIIRTLHWTGFIA